MAHSSWLGPARLCDHASKAPNTCAVHPRLSPEGTRRHRMGAYLGGPRSPALAGHHSRASPRPAPTVAEQRCPGARGGGVNHSSLLPGPKVKTGPGLSPGPPLV